MAVARRLLTVDDSELDGEVIAHTLRIVFPNAEVRRVADPSTVERLCGEEQFDCVFIDYDMPVIDGLTLAARLRAADAYLPLILVTSVGNEMLVGEAHRAGVSDYIPKPRVTPDAVRRIAERTIHSCAQSKLIDEQRGELENFAYALAHDFKQPIRQIVTFSRMLGNDIHNSDTADVVRHLDFLVTAATRLDKLVDVLVQYTLLNKPPPITEVGLDGVAENIRDSLAPFIAERGGEFVAPLQSIRVKGNETLMTQVLQNLVVNGLHYNRSEHPRVEITAEFAEGNWEIAVRDNGIGIDRQYLADIFKPLVRLHAASEYAGSGLGLTLARKAMLVQKGEIWCESTLGEGSVFRLRLPGSEVRGTTTKRRRASLPGKSAPAYAPRGAAANR